MIHTKRDHTLDVWSFSVCFENVTELPLAEINCLKFPFDNVFWSAPEAFIIYLIRWIFCTILKIPVLFLSFCSNIFLSLLPIESIYLQFARNEKDWPWFTSGTSHDLRRDENEGITLLKSYGPSLYLKCVR